MSWNVHDWINSTTPTAANVLAAVDAFEAATKQDGTVLQIPLRPGTGVLLDNFRVMHGRGAMSPMRRLIVGFEAPNAPVEEGALETICILPGLCPAYVHAARRYCMALM